MGRRGLAGAENSAVRVTAAEPGLASFVGRILVGFKDGPLSALTGDVSGPAPRLLRPRQAGVLGQGRMSSQGPSQRRSDLRPESHIISQ